MSQKSILAIACDFVEDYEIMVPFQMLKLAGHKIDVVSPGKKPGDIIATAIHDFEGYQTFTEKKGHNFTLNADFETSQPAKYDALLIPGGRAPEMLTTYPSVVERIKMFQLENKPIAAICHGGLLLAAADIIKDKKVSAFPSCKMEIELAGGHYQSIAMDEAITDGNLVTAPAWPAHPAWIGAFLKLLGTTITT